jgi:hypothetical protein
MAALVLIYGLIVWEFKNFALGGLIMSPIPLTMLGIIPGHWMLGAEFTATSMIGMIALGGIIVRQSILIVEFVKIEVAQGREVKEAAIRGAELRMRPIFITSLTLMAGAFAILQDPIFNGMAISLLFGAGVATVMAVIVIPLGCISARKQFYVQTSDDGRVSISPAFEQIEHTEKVDISAAPKTSLLMRLWGGIFSMFSWVFYIFRAMFTMLGMGFKAIFGRFGRSGGGTPPPPRGGTPPPPRGGTPPPREQPPAGGTPPPPRETPPPASAAPATAQAKPAGGTPPPPREMPKPTGGTPPPPREAPKPAAARTEVKPAGGTPPPPREAPKPAEARTEVKPAGGTPPPPRETPPAAAMAAADVELSAEHGEQADTDADDETGNGAVGRKRRGIRLKQDLG